MLFNRVLTSLHEAMCACISESNLLDQHQNSTTASIRRSQVRRTVRWTMEQLQDFQPLLDLQLEDCDMHALQDLPHLFPQLPRRHFDDVSWQLVETVKSRIQSVLQ